MDTKKNNSLEDLNFLPQNHAEHTTQTHTHTQINLKIVLNSLIFVIQFSQLSQIWNLMRILGQIFGPKRDENREWRRLHNEELHCLYRSVNIVRVIKSRILRWAGHVDRMEESRSSFKMLTGKPTKKRPLGRPRRRCENLEEIGVNAGNWVDSAQDRDYWKALVNTALNFRVP
jgi:hypothetical protein